jgi:hypothetical protein
MTAHPHPKLSEVGAFEARVGAVGRFSWAYCVGQCGEREVKYGARLNHDEPKLLNIIISSMAQPIPQALSQLVALNDEYSELICIGNG